MHVCLCVWVFVCLCLCLLCVCVCVCVCVYAIVFIIDSIYDCTCRAMMMPLRHSAIARAAAAAAARDAPAPDDIYDTIMRERSSEITDLKRRIDGVYVKAKAGDAAAAAKVKELQGELKRVEKGRERDAKELEQEIKTWESFR